MNTIVQNWVCGNCDFEDWCLSIALISFGSWKSHRSPELYNHGSSFQLGGNEYQTIFLCVNSLLAKIYISGSNYVNSHLIHEIILAKEKCFPNKIF